MDRFEELVSRSAKAAVFAPGTLWRKFGENQVIRQRVGDTLPVLFVPCNKNPPPLGAGTTYTFKAEHFGVHAFITFAAEGSAGSIRLVAALCLLDGACRAAAEHLLETTRDANGELGGLPISFMFAAAEIGRANGNFVSAGVLQFKDTHLVNAYRLWQMTPAADREVLKDRRCPVCRATGG